MAEKQVPGTDGAARPPLHRRVRGALGREARGLMSPGPPTAELMPPIGPQVPADARVQETLDLCMRVGEVLLSSGSNAMETTDAMVRLANACGLPAVDVDITFTSITMCCQRGMTAIPITSMRLVRYRTLDLTRLTAVTDLAARVERGELGVNDAEVELASIVRAPHPFPRWIATVGWAGLAAAVSVMLGGTAATAAAAFVVTAVIDRLGRLLGRWGLPAFFQQVMGGALATGATLALFAAGFFPPGTQASLVVAAGITVLLSGLSLVGTVQDAMSSYFVTAAGRAAEIALLSAGLLVGVVLALKVGVRFGVVLDVAAPLPTTPARFGLSVAAAGVATAAYAVAGYSPLCGVFAAMIAGAAGWGTYNALTGFLGFGPVAATALAAAVVGAAVGLLRRTRVVPPLVVTLAGITPLLPGIVAYRGFYQLANGDVATGLVTIGVALATGLAIAAGVTLGEFLTHGRARRPRPDG